MLTFSKSFASTPQAITTAGTLNLAHGLGAKAYGVSISLVNVTAELGYTPGDTLYSDFSADLGGGNGNGVAVLCGTTSLAVKFGSHTATFRGLNFSNGNAAGFTNANWNIIIRAWL